MIQPVPVALYARYSTDRQDARSIDDQLRRCRAFAAERGYVVTSEYKDAAVSGAHLDRADMQRMLAAARQAGGAAFRAVLVDDLSRLSRDLGSTWRIVFEDLASVDVKVVDVTTGMASDGAGARLTFGAMALVNDTFLQLVRTETHRGLQGRALAGFWTGGRVYGFSTVEEENPPDPEHRRKRPVIHPAEAENVRRVFKLFVEDGMSCRLIAARFNDEGIPAPHDGGKGHKIGRGWGHTTIRAMLMNERYLGRFVWNQSKWVRVPGKKSRRRVMRPDAERVVTECPELAIVSRDVFDVAQARFRTEPRGKRTGRPHGTGRTPYLISGLLRCGTCGGSMSVRAKRVRKGAPCASFGCTMHYSRGASICSNNLTVSEDKVSEAIIGALDDLFSDTRVIAAFVQAFEQRLCERNAEAAGDTTGLDKRIRESEGRIRNVTDALARVGWSDGLATQLQDEERRLSQLRTERARLSKGATVATPAPERIAGFLRESLGVLRTDPVKGREFLTKHLAPVVMTPEGEGRERHYRMTGAFDMAAAIKHERPHQGPSMFAKSSSGGEI